MVFILNINEVLPLFDNVKAINGGYTASCPVCGDKKHLYITPKTDKVLFFCHKCGAGFDEIRKIVPFPKSNAPTTIKEQCDHVYKNTDGTVAYYKQRTKYSDGKKKFTFYYYEGENKVFKKPEVCNNLYNLDLLQKAQESEILYIVEGEKCADIMTKHGFLATTTNTGAGSGKIKFTETDQLMLEKFTQKVIIPDNDEAGKKYVKSFENVDVLKLSDIWEDIKPKQDIYDYIKLGGDTDKIRNYEFEVIKDFSELSYEELFSDKLFDRVLSIDDNDKANKAKLSCFARAKALRSFMDFKQEFKERKNTYLQEKNKDNRTNFHGAPVILRCNGFIADMTGVYKETTNKEGETFRVLVSAIPILPVEILHNKEENTEKVKIAYYKNKWEYLVCDRATIATASKIVELANNGIEVSSVNALTLVEYLSVCMSKNFDVLPRINTVSRLGFFGEEFVPYCDNIEFDGDSENENLFKSFTEHGDYDLWVRGTNKLRNNIYLRLMMNASFASPLLKVLGGLPFVFHLWGGTEAGKTVALMVAMSIWGDPSLGKLVKTMNMTTNSMMSMCGFLHHVPFAGDELQTIKSKFTDYDSIIMKVCEGIDRGRMSYDKIIRTKTWNNTILFTGEEPCTKSSSGGGAKNRVIEVEVNGKVIEKGNATANFARENFGFAGKRFLDIIKQKKNLQERFDEIYLDIQKYCDTTDKQGLSMAFILLADELVSEHIYGVKALTCHDIKQFVKSKTEVDTSVRAYEFVINLVARHSPRFASPEHNYSEVWGKEEPNYVMINKDVLCSKLSEQGFDFEALKKKWADEGKLLKNSQGRFFHCTKCFGVKGIYIKMVLDSQDNYEVIVPPSIYKEVPDEDFSPEQYIPDEFAREEFIPDECEQNTFDIYEEYDDDYWNELANLM